MRYTILDNPPWWEAIALGFQVGCTPTPAFRDPSSAVERHVAWHTSLELLTTRTPLLLLLIVCSVFGHGCCVLPGRLRPKPQFTGRAAVQLLATSASCCLAAAADLPHAAGLHRAHPLHLCATHGRLSHR